MSIKLCLFRNILCSLIECGVACNIRGDDCNVFWIKDGVCELGNKEPKLQQPYIFYHEIGYFCWRDSNTTTDATTVDVNFKGNACNKQNGIT